MTYSGHRKLLCELSKLSKFNAFLPPRILNEHLQIPPKDNRFQYVRRVYKTAINFPCITFLRSTKKREDFARIKKHVFSFKKYLILY